MRHIQCPNADAENPASETVNVNFEHTLSFTELRDSFRLFSEGTFTKLKQDENRKRMAEIAGSSWSDERFSGGKISDTLEWLDRGFIVEGLAGVDSSLFPARPKRKFRYADEGDEMLIDLVLAGVDEHYQVQEKRIAKPGLKVEIGCTFNAGMPAKLIADYQRWVARMLSSLDEAAIDCEINLVTRSKGSYRGDEITEHKVNVKRAGEASDFASWSAMFAPTGFRHLSFAQIVLGADFHGKHVAYGLGSAQYEKQWLIEYDENENLLRIGNPGDSREFPEFEMTEKFRAILTKLGG